MMHYYNYENNMWLEIQPILLIMSVQGLGVNKLFTIYPNPILQSVIVVIRDRLEQKPFMSGMSSTATVYTTHCITFKQAQN